MGPTAGSHQGGVKTNHRTERILTTHTGSLPRPPALAESLYQHWLEASGDEAALESQVQAAVRAVVKRQLDAGLDVVNDGEMGRVSYATYATERLTGFEGESPDIPIGDLAEFPGLVKRFLSERAGGKTRRRPACTGRVRHAGSDAIQRDVARLRSAVGDAQPAALFLTAASPGVLAYFHENRYYPTQEAYLDALADAMRVEYQAIVDAGFMLQIDCPDLAMARHQKLGGEDLDTFKRFAAGNVAALNRAVAGIDPGRMRMHVCWGNYEGPHHLDVPLGDILEIVFSAAPAGLAFESANPRHAHEWTLFREVRLPPGKVLIPGVIDSTTNYIEHPELVALRIEQLARLVGRENVIAGVDCGFGTSAGSSRVDPDVAWAKLRSLAQGAEMASRRLWA